MNAQRAPGLSSPGPPAALHALPPSGQAGPARLADAWAALRRSADALGIPEHGVLTVSRLQRRLRGIAERAAGLPRTRVAILECGAPMRSAGRWLPEVAALAGADDVLAEPGSTPAVVTLGESDPPGLVFFVPPGLDLARACDACAVFARLPAWTARRGLELVVCNGRALLGGGGENLAATLEVIAEVLHPAAFRFGHEGRLWRRVRT